MLSGLRHQRQRSGQPFKKTDVRIPGPSWIENRWISKMRPVTKTSLLPVLHARDDVLLQLRRETHEELAEAGNANHQILVLLGVLLGGAERFAAHHIDLQLDIIGESYQ